MFYAHYCDKNSRTASACGRVGHYELAIELMKINGSDVDSDEGVTALKAMRETLYLIQIEAGEKNAQTVEANILVRGSANYGSLLSTNYCGIAPRFAPRKYAKVMQCGLNMLMF